MADDHYLAAVDSIETCLKSIAGSDNVKSYVVAPAVENDEDHETDGSSAGGEGTESEVDSEDSEGPAEYTNSDQISEDDAVVLMVTEAVGPDYVVICPQESKYFIIQSGYNLFGDIYEHVSEEKAREYFEEKEVDGGSEDLRVGATVEILNSISKDEKKDLIYQLTEIFTDAAVKYQVNQIDGGGISEFDVRYRIFPYADDFTITRLNDVIERVRMATQQGRLYLRYSFQLGVDFQEDTVGDATDGFSPRSSGPINISNQGPD